MKRKIIKEKRGKANWCKAFPKQWKKLNQASKFMPIAKRMLLELSGKVPIPKQTSILSDMATIHLKKPIKSRTSKRAAEERIYRAEVKEALLLPQNQVCRVWLASDEFLKECGPFDATPSDVRKSFKMPATQCHHKYGRRLELLLWRPGWRFVSDAGHKWIDRHPKKARELGLLGPVGTYNDFARAVKHHQEDLSEWQACIICGAKVWNPNPKTATCDPICTRARNSERTRDEQIRWEIENLKYEPQVEICIECSLPINEDGECGCVI